jgi:trehalose 6-phosphate phosphatase
MDCFDELRSKVRAAPALALFLDFDGTLVPLSDDPNRVTMPGPLRRILEELSSRKDCVVAIVSGRERADLQTRIAIPGLIYVGNHGLEISGPGFIFVEALAIGYREPIQKLAESLTPRIKPFEGAWVEDKGLTISVHWRRVAPTRAEELRRAIHSALESTSHPFLLTTGEKVYDIRPRVYWHKGEAVNWILEHYGRKDALPFYLGDDTTDEDAFVALPDAVTVKVGDAADTAANYYLRSPEEVGLFLEWLVHLVH